MRKYSAFKCRFIITEACDEWAATTAAASNSLLSHSKPTHVISSISLPACPWYAPCPSRKSLHIFECLLFETDDLIMRKNEKHVILCLLEVARIGARFGMEAPMLVQMERQIDREIAADNKAMGISIGTETDKMSHSISVGADGNLFDSDSEDEDNIADEPLLMYGPQPQIITNDLKSLDEMVSEGSAGVGRYVEEQRIVNEYDHRDEETIISGDFCN